MSLFRHRVHLLIIADELLKPVSFRTDVILAVRDPERARVRARAALVDQDPLTCARVLSSTVDTVEISTL